MISARIRAVPAPELKRPETRRRRTLAVVAAFVLAHTAVLFLIPREPAFQTEIFRGYADRIASGDLPYAAFPYEYPPASLFILILPRLFTADPETYAFLFGAEMLFFDIVILLALSRVSWRAATLYGVGILLFWRLPFIRHDLVPVAFSTLGALFLLWGRNLLAAVFWGAGGALKLYPMAAAPALAFGASFRQTVVRWTVAGAVFAAGILWGVLAFGPQALSFLTYHADRPAMVESIPANIQLLLPGHEVIRSYGSFNVVGPFGETLTGFFGVFQLVATGLALLVCYQQAGQRPRLSAIRGAAAATFAFAVFGKVLSPHFLFWPLPLLAIATAIGGVRSPRVTWALFFGVIALTTFINSEYYAISANLPYFTALLTARNVLLLPLFTLILLRPNERQKDGQDEPTRERRVK